MYTYAVPSATNSPYLTSKVAKHLVFFNNSYIIVLCRFDVIFSPFCVVRFTVTQPIDHRDDARARLNESGTPEDEIDTIVDAVRLTSSCPVVCVFC